MATQQATPANPKRKVSLILLITGFWVEKVFVLFLTGSKIFIFCFLNKRAAGKPIAKD